MTLNYILIVACLFVSAYFSAAETSYASANEVRLKLSSEQKKGLYAVAYGIKQNFSRALITILIGNNLANILSSSIATVIAVDILGEGGAWVATVIMTLLVITFGEVIPKILAKEYADGLVCFFAVPLRVLMIVLWPVTFVFDAILKLTNRKRNGEQEPTVTEDDLETIFDTVEEEGVMDEDSCDLLQSALEFDEVLAYEIITPRVDMVALDIEDEWEEQRRICFASPYTRLPVYRDTPDNIIGVLHLNHLYKHLVNDVEVDISELLMPAVFVHKTTALPDVLNHMRKSKQHMVIVTDEYGGTMGILTMEDILEQLVGDIWDESDEIVNEFVEVAENTYEVDGDMRLVDFFDEFDKDEEEIDDDNATVGGWAVEMLNGYPKLHESFSFEDLTVTIIKRNNLRVLRLMVQVDPTWQDEDEDDDLF
ncbi:MAG: hemolysin family protein [Clostridia bacterium]|nr:hemolysin family protein [Clostridia bacterium]